jgi:exosortase
VVVALTVIFVWPTLVHAIEVWSVDDEFSYGFLVIPICVLLAWQQRRAFRSNATRGADSGLILVLAAAGAILLNGRVGINALSGLAVTPLVLGICAYLCGWTAARSMAFPIAFSAFGLGVYRGAFDFAGFALQHVTAQASEVLANSLGLAVTRDDLVLTVRQYAFLVTEECSGLSSLVSLLAVASLWIWFVRGSHLARLSTLLAVVPLVLAANVMRVTAVLAVASDFGPETAVGFFHGASSLVLFGMALAGLIITGRLLGCRLTTLG